MRNLILRTAAVLALLFGAGICFAGQAQDLTAIVGNLETNIRSLADLLTIVSYVAGIGFAIAGVVQFKAHKDNPAQVPLSKPIVYLAVGAGLLFLPTIIETAGTTVFAGSETRADQGLD